MISICWVLILFPIYSVKQLINVHTTFFLLLFNVIDGVMLKCHLFTTPGAHLVGEYLIWLTIVTLSDQYPPITA